MNAAALLTRGFTVIRREGLRGVIGRLLTEPTTIDSFDIEHDIDTSTPVPLWKLRTNSKDLADAVRYQPISTEAFHEAIKQLPIAPRNYTFIDIGSGKGRALILAAEAGFNRVIGVEFDSDLCSESRNNLASLGLAADVVCESGGDYAFPKEPTVAFLFNPFGPSVLRRMLEHLHSETYLVYANPRHADVIEAIPIYRSKDIAIWQIPGSLRNP